MVKRLIPLVLVFGFLLTGMTFAQGDNPLLPTYQRPPIYIGPVFGYNRSMHSVNLASFDEAICPRFQDGNSNGFYAGLSWEQMLGEAATSTSSIIVRVLYNTMPAYLETSENPIPSLVTVVDANGNPINEVVLNSSTVHTQDINYSMFTGEVMYKLNPIPGLPLGITVGPTFDFAMTKTQDQKYKLELPLEAQFKRNPSSGYTYEDNDRTIVIKSGDIPGSEAFRFALKAGLQYEIITSGKMYIVPAVYYNFGITNLSSKENWRVNALQMGVDIRFAL